MLVHGQLGPGENLKMSVKELLGTFTILISHAEKSDVKMSGLMPQTGG